MKFNITSTRKFNYRIEKWMFTTTGCVVVAIFVMCASLGKLSAQVPEASTMQDDAVEAAQVFYVSPHGNDRWSGQLADPRPDLEDGPFATIERARDAVRSWRGRRSPELPVKVKIRGGTYFLNRPIEFQPRDSGTEASPVIYQAYPGERPVISGGRVIGNLQSEDNQVYRTTVPEAKDRRWIFRQLFVDDERMILARTPNSGYFRFAGPADRGLHPPANAREERSYDSQFYRFHPGQLKAWDNIEDVNLVTFFSWHIGILPLGWVDEDTLTFFTLRPNRNGLAGRVGEEMRYFIENSPDCLDAPGEWQLNRDTGELRLIPYPGQLDSSSKVVAPRLEHLLLIRGNASTNRWVEHIHFKGLSFRHTDFPLPPDGYSDTQAARIVSAAVEVEGARQVQFSDNEFTQMGNHALWLREGANRTLVFRNHFHDLGGGAVYIGDRDQPQRTGMQHSPPPVGQRVGFHQVENNLIHETGRIFKQSHGIWIGQSSDNLIRHNEISHTSYSPIGIGWSWGYEPTDCNRNLVEFNYIHDGMRNALPDGGGIYTLGLQVGTVIRNNVILRTYGYRQYQGAGIYPDEGSTGIVFSNNIVHGSSSGSVNVNHGSNLTFENNIFSGNASGAMFKRGRNVADGGANLTIRRNLFYVGGEMFGGPGTLKEVDRNLYIDANEAAMLRFPLGASLHEWQEQSGFDENSLNVSHDFARHHMGNGGEDDPRAKIGFVPIEVGKTGRYGDEEWLQIAQRMNKKYARPDLPPFAHYWPDIRDRHGRILDNFEAGANLAVHRIESTDEVKPRASHLRFSIREASGERVRLERFSFAARSTGGESAPTRYEVRTSADAFSTAVASGKFRTDPGAGNSWYFYENVISPLKPVKAEDLEIRLYLLGGNGEVDPNCLRIDDIVIMAVSPGHRIEDASLPTIFTYTFESESLAPIVTTEALTPTAWRSQQLSADPLIMVNLSDVDICNQEPSEGYTGASGKIMVSGITGDSDFLPRRRSGAVSVSVDRYLSGGGSLKLIPDRQEDAVFQYNVTSVAHNPMVDGGKVSLAYHLYVGAGDGKVATRLVDMDEKHGLDLWVDARDGGVYVGGVKRGTLPIDAWSRILVKTGVGIRNNATWSITATDPDGTIHFRGEDLDFDPDFGELRAVEWHAQQTGGQTPVFHLDEVAIIPERSD